MGPSSLHRKTSTRRPQTEDFYSGLENYGFGWGIITIPAGEPGAGQTLISHGGGINGFNTLEDRLIGDHDFIVIFNNTPGMKLEDLSKGIRAILYGQEPAAPKRILAHDLAETIVSRGVDATIARYRELKRLNSRGYTFDDNALNPLGYALLRENRISEAIAIFQLNVEEYPKSGDAYDSLAGAYAKDGQKQKANVPLWEIEAPGGERAERARDSVWSTDNIGV